MTNPCEFDMTYFMSEVQIDTTRQTQIGVPTERLCRVLELAIGDSPLEETLSELILIVEIDVTDRSAGVDPASRRP